MKTLFAVVALAGVIATPTFAQEMFFQQKLVVNPGAAQPPIQRTGPHSNNAANDVYDTAGNYVGSDPDAQVRNLLRTNRGDD